MRPSCAPRMQATSVTVASSRRRGHPAGSGASSTDCVCAARNTASRSRTPGSERARIAAASRAALTAPARPIASVPTGIPAGICTIESSESIPLSVFDSTGTPRTGRAVFAAAIPGRCAAPPAPAISTCRPRASAEPAYSKRRSGVRCAETTRCSKEIPSALSVSAACCIVSQSEREPMIRPTTGSDTRSLLPVRLLDEQERDRAGGLSDVGVGLVVGGDAVQDHDRLAGGCAVLEADDRKPPHGDVRVARSDLVQQRPERVDVARMRAGQALERDQRRAANGRALVLEAASQELDLLAEPELDDRPVGHRAHPVVAIACRRLDLVAPLEAQVGKLLLEPALRVLVGEGCCLRELHQWAARVRGPGPTYVAEGRTRRPSRFCSSTCADQPAVLEHANIAGASDGGTSATSSTTADQNSTFVARTRSGLRRWSSASAARSSSSATSKRGEPRSIAVPRSRRDRGSSAL